MNVCFLGGFFLVFFFFGGGMVGELGGHFFICYFNMVLTEITCPGSVHRLAKYVVGPQVSWARKSCRPGQKVAGLVKNSKDMQIADVNLYIFYIYIL